jgi:AraC-like DNA-binding protein/mannose-6-phosphate isomerase-like protein (cupin superfamily)
MINFHYLDNEKYNDIQLLRMKDNNHGDLPFYMRIYNRDTMTVYMHRHEYMQINYVYQGRGRHVVSDHEFDIVKGDIFVIPPYIPHRILPFKNMDIEIFEFEFNMEFVNQNINSIENIKSFFDFAYIEPFLVTENQVKPRLNLAGKIQLEVEDILSEVMAEYKNRYVGFELMIKSLLLKLLVVVGREFSRNIEDEPDNVLYDRHKDSILKAIQYIEENYSQDLSIEDVAQKAMLSQSYFCYLFKNITSKTFTEYVNNLRISKTMELLKNTNNRVLDICYEAGFNNICYYNRLFKQRTGVSPTAFRKISKAKRQDNDLS